MKKLVTLTAMAFLASPLMAETVTVYPTTQISIASSGSASSGEFGQVNGVTKQTCAKWTGTIIPEFAKLNSVTMHASFASGTAAGQLNMCGQSFYSSSTWNSLGQGMTLATFVAIKGGGQTGLTQGLTSHSPNWQQWSMGNSAWEGIVFGSAGSVTSYSTVTSVSLVVDYTPRIGGDVDEDGDVDFQDFLQFAPAYNAGGSGWSWSDGDFDYDGDVDFQDFLVLSRNFGG